MVVALGDHRLGLPMKPLHLHQHPHEGGRDRCARLGQHSSHAASTGVFEPASLAMDRHAHGGRLCPHLELGEKPPQLGVRRVVVDDEPGVHRYGPRIGRDDVMGVGVAPESRRGFEEGHIETTLEQVCRREPGNPCPDDGYPRAPRRYSRLQRHEQRTPVRLLMTTPLL
jgi:hypothetical protein